MLISTISNRRGKSIILPVAAGLLFLSSSAALAQTNSMDHDSMNHEEMSQDSMDMGNMKKVESKNDETMGMDDMQMPPEHAAMNHDSMPLQQNGESTVPDPSHVHAEAEKCEPPGKLNPASGAPACWPDPVMDQMLFGKLLLDQLELGFGDAADTYAWEADAWYGGDHNKIWFKTEGEGLQDGGTEEAELQVLYSHLISPFFDVQTGLRYDIEPGPGSGRGFAVLGLQGLAPYWFETDTALFVSEDGDLSIRGEFEYELLFTQRLILTPRLEFTLAAQDVPEYGIGSGLTSTKIGLRLRYEIQREFAPYLGVSYERLYGDTKAFAVAAGEEPSRTVVVAGVRVWF